MVWREPFQKVIDAISISNARELRNNNNQLTMPRCTHKGCGKDYDEATNAEDSCSYHSGGPVRSRTKLAWVLVLTAFIGVPRRSQVVVYVELSRSYPLLTLACCKDVNKPVLEFDQFMALPVSRGAARGSLSSSTTGLTSSTLSLDAAAYDATVPR